MEAKEEAELMLLAKERQEVAAPQHQPDDRSTMLGSPPTEPAPDDDDDKSDKPLTLAVIYNKAEYVSRLRYLFNLVIFCSSIWLVSQGTRPKGAWIILPWAGYSLCCATVHAVVANPLIFRSHPRSATNASPSRAYIVTAVASALSLLSMIGVGLAVLVLTGEFFGERDKTRTIPCWGRNAKRRTCYPFTYQGNVYNLSIVCFSFTGIALLCALGQLYNVFVRIPRTRWTEEDILEAWKLKDAHPTRDRAKRIWRMFVKKAA
ncbi:hypothetical protein VTI28DRAFT_7314 [Corynascus sepedonium]